MHDQVTETVDRPLRDISVPTALPAGTLIDDRYEILRILGHGGSAVVYAARDLRLKQDVALKILRLDRLSDTAVRRLQREVSIARRASDRRLIRIFDIAEFDQGTYLTMELFDAPTLRKWMHGRRLDIDEVIRVALQILEALAALHQVSVVHRDVKPSNILIGSDGEIKLGDFGLALLLAPDESRLTQTAGLVGTLEYLSPEQALGAEVDHRSDLYSFGVLLFELLSGRLPFESASSIGTVVAHVNRPAPDVRKFRRDTPRWLAQTINGLLQKEPSRRFPDVASVRTILQKRRLPLSLLLPWLRVAAAAIIVVAIVLVAAYMWLSHRFARVVNDGGTTITALDRRGRALWSMRGVQQGNNTALFRQRGSLQYVAVVKDPGLSADLAHNHDLQLVNPQSGEVVRTVRLPDWASSFPEFSKEFHVTSMGAVDVNGRGDDAVIVSYCHSVYWPSYTVIYDPRSQAVGTLFVGSGHHHYVGSVDFNGDGRRDVLLVGINNRMGWSVAAAAIDVRTNSWGFEIAVSPDAAYVPSGSRALIWYALLPAGGPKSTSIHEWNRRFTVEYNDGRTESVGFDGFPVGQYRLPQTERTRYRQSAYQDLREAGRLVAGGFLDDAVASAERARTEANQSEDPFLLEWINRSYATILIKAGRIDEGERAFQAASARSSSPSEVAFESAKTLHLQGALDRAVTWYNRGLGLNASGESGRGRYEFVEGEVLALGEMGRWDEALQAVHRYDAEYREWPYAAAFRQYIQWRRGEKVERPVDVNGTTTDLVRYWNLEIAYRNGMAPAALLEAIDRERRRSSGDTLLLSLRSEVLSQMGRNDDALDDARKAFQAAVPNRLTNTEIRAHFVIIATRLIHQARAAGRLQEVRNAEAQLRSVKR